MKIIKYLFILIALFGIIAYATKPSDEKCIRLSNEFAGKYLTRVEGDSTKQQRNSIKPVSPGSVIVEDNYFFKSIYYTRPGYSIRIGSASFGKIKLSYTTRKQTAAGQPEPLHPMLIIFSL